MPVTRFQLCCGCLPMFSGICGIAFHSFVHGIYGLCLILTTYYAPQNDAVNYVAVVGYACLVIIGIPMLWVVVFQHRRCIFFMAALIIFLTTLNLTCGILYFVWYVSFKANSLLDKVFLWRYGMTWVTAKELPFCIWHLLTGLLLALTPLWFYYGYVIAIYPKYLKTLEEQEPHIPQIIIMDNMMGPYGYRPPIGYPYSTNEAPGSTSNENRQNVNIFVIDRSQHRQRDGSPTSVLD